MCSICGRTVELIVEIVHPEVKRKATCKALTMGARLDFDAILQQTYLRYACGSSGGVGHAIFEALAARGV